MNISGNNAVIQLTSKSDDIKHMYEYLSNKYTKSDILDISNNIIKVFNGHKIVDKENPTNGIKYFDQPITSASLKKDCIWPAAIVLGDNDNFREYFDLFPEGIKQVWDLCYRKMYANANEANKLAGGEILKKKTTYFSTSYSVSHPLLSLISCSSYYYHYHKDMQPYMSMPTYLWQLYNRSIANKDIHPLDKLPVDHSMLSYSNESNVGEQLLMLKQMQAQGMLEFGATKMTQTTIKKAAQQIGLKEFFPETNDKNLKLMAAQLMIPSIASNSLSAIKGNFNEYWSTLRLITKTHNVKTIAMEWISHLKSVKRDLFLEDSHLSDSIANIIETMNIMPSGKWLSYEDFDKLRRCMNDVGPDDIEVTSHYFVSSEKQTHAISGRRLRVDEIYDYITTPVCKGFLFTLATYGLLEVAYHVPAGVTPIYGCLDYIRLTKLGEYAFNQTEEYNAPGIHKPTEYFEMDDERLIIRAIQIDGKNPYENMLQNVAENIGAHRYRITIKTFMDGCSNQEDLDHKWNFITNNICDKPSAIWQELYADAKRRCLPLMNAGIGYSLKKIKEDNYELMHIMTTDKYIREHIIRAERNHVLIETKCMEKVKATLRKYGYIL